MEPLQEKGLTALHEELTNQILGYKADSEVDAYFNCWKETEESLRLYRTSYRKFILAAAKASGVPFSILACLYFYESKFNSRVVAGVKKSSAGALGMAQVMPKTWNSIVRKLDPRSVPSVSNPYVVLNLRRGLESLPRQKQSILRTYIDGIDEIYRIHSRESGQKSMSGKSNLLGIRARLIELAKVEDYAKSSPVEEYLSIVDSALAHHQAQEIFNEYRRLLGHSKAVLSPTDPEDAAIVGAIHLRLESFQGQLGDQIHRASRDQWIMAAGAYNAGSGRFKCKMNESAEVCIAKTGVKETREHMIGIRNCSERGNSKDKRDQSPPTSCREESV